MANLEKLKTLIPLEELEYDCQSQIYNALELDFVKKVCIMPDAHTGYLAPIGSIILLDKVISPEYVGFDQGCGMCCLITSIKAKDLKHKDLIKIFNEIINKIPTGFTSREHGIDHETFKSASGDKQLTKDVNDKLHKQKGTLGGGNHFLELGENTNGYITITIHSGSRKTGHLLCTYHSNISNLNDKDLPNGFLHLNGDFGQSYIKDLDFALQYALDNRKVMMQDILKILGLSDSLKGMINENHNHAIVLSNGDVLHRKGATPADKGQIGVIPGNMRDGVYITEGLGNQEFLSSASHGAGRKFSRSKAKDTLSMDSFKAQMKDVVCIVDPNILDEAPDAYKDVTAVIDRQKGIVIDVIDFIKPLINIKASEEGHRDRRKKNQEARRKERKAREQEEKLYS